MMFAVDILPGSVLSVSMEAPRTLTAANTRSVYTYWLLVSTCRERLRNTFNALMLRMSGEQICLQVPPELLGVNSWIAQMIRQWIADCWSGNRKSTVTFIGDALSMVHEVYLCGPHIFSWHRQFVPSRSEIENALLLINVDGIMPG